MTLAARFRPAARRENDSRYKALRSRARHLPCLMASIFLPLVGTKPPNPLTLPDNPCIRCTPLHRIHN